MNERGIHVVSSTVLDIVEELDIKTEDLMQEFELNHKRSKDCYALSSEAKMMC